MNKLNEDCKDIKENKLLKISSEEFLNNLEKRGLDINKELKKKLYQLDKKSKNENIKKENLFEEFDIAEDLQIMFEVFSILDEYNINYINYILIFDYLEIQQCKNFYRYLLIKWNKTKNNLNQIHKNDIYLKKINDFNFQDITSNIQNDHNKNRLKKNILMKFKKFININNNTFPNIFIIFLINTLQEYLYPI